MSNLPGHQNVAIPADCGGAIVIDIDAVRSNYRHFQNMAGPVAVGASLKADAYGLGVERVAPALAAAGCDIFFVALPAEGITLRRILPSACVVVLSGPAAASTELFVKYRLSPALNSLDQIADWQRLCRNGADVEAAVLHIDTGMSRLGLSPQDVARLAAEPERLEGVALQCVLSHLACADEADHPFNARQREEFVAATAALAPATGEVPRSLANSSGVFLGADYHFDLVRPGAALYGINPTPCTKNPMRQTVGLYARILQVREIDTPQSVGYGAAYQAAAPTRIATVAIGYADGYMRAVGRVTSGKVSASGTADIAHAYIGESAVPVVGRISMDLITLDVSSVTPELAKPGSIVELMGDHVPLDALAAWSDTIGYEVLTGLGPRLHRIYTNGAA